MGNKVSKKIQADIDFINGLSLEGVLSWPIDYEANLKSINQTLDDLDYWFGGKKWRESGHTFMQFGQDGCGSLFCLWFYPDLHVDPPVVFLGSEGERAVVSNDVHDFAKQITSGKIFHGGDWLEPDEDEKSVLDWERLLQKAKLYLGENISRPKELSELARKKHPNLSEWIDTVVE